MRLLKALESTTSLLLLHVLLLGRGQKPSPLESKEASDSGSSALGRLTITLSSLCFLVFLFLCCHIFRLCGDILHVKNRTDTFFANSLFRVFVI